LSTMGFGTDHIEGVGVSELCQAEQCSVVGYLRREVATLKRRVCNCRRVG
jgi:hypothetical protein